MRVRTRTLVTTGLIGAIVVIGVLASPLLLAAAGSRLDVDWQQLADVGQAYGTASAVLSALAVAGVAASLIYQARQLRLARVQAVRDWQYALLSRVMDDPETFAPVTGMIDSTGAALAPRQHCFATSWMNYARMSFESGIANENALRTEILPQFFAGEIGRRWWEAVADDWHSHTEPLYRSFAAIVEDEYRKAVASAPATPALLSPPSGAPPSDPASSAGPAPYRFLKVAGLVAVAVVAGCVAGRRTATRR